MRILYLFVAQTLVERLFSALLEIVKYRDSSDTVNYQAVILNLYVLLLKVIDKNNFIPILSQLKKT